MLRNSEMERSPEAAIIQWINTFTISHPVTQMQELSDGIILFEVASDIDSKWFKSIRSADVGDNWVLKHNNLKKLYKVVSRYYEEILGIPFSNFPEVDLNAIAKDADTRAIVQLCKYILTSAVVGPNNSKYIPEIQLMSESDQKHLKAIIEETLNYAQQEPNEPQEISDNYTQSSYMDDGTYRSQSELTRISREKEELEIQNKQLIDKHSELLTKYDKLENEKQDLQVRLKDMDTAVAQANETGRADFIMRTEIDHLKQDLQKSEDTRQEQERRLEDLNRQIRDLTRVNEDLTVYESQAAALKDQVDEHRHAAEKLQKAENVIEKYKKKMEDTADLKRQMKLLEEQNHALVTSYQKLEEEYRKVLAFKTLMDSYKDQVANLETKNNELIREKNKMEYELTYFNKKMELMEADKARDSDRIQALEDHLQEAQLGMSTADAPSSQRAANDDVEDMDIDDYNLNNSLEESLKESNVTELKLSKRRLERQVKTLQEERAAGGGGGGGGGESAHQKVLVLQHLLDDANRLKTKFEKSYLEVSQERDILQSDMARIREGIPDAIVDQSEKTLSLRLRIIELEKETKSLNETVAKLEQKISEGRFQGDDEGMEDILKKYNELEAKSNALEEQTKKQLQDINKLLLEKDILHGQSLEQKDLLLVTERMNSDLKESLAAFKAKDDEPFKQKNVELQQQLIKLQEELYSNKKKLINSKQFISQQDKLIKELKQQGESGNFDEAVKSLQTEVKMRDEEIEKFKRQLHETRNQNRREQQLMISAWYDMSRRANRDVASNKASPISWLGQQRRTLDNQLKRR
ncbi:hypothetical protein HMPREF1544_09981 [Mucor circinelloides 1006PhL]|uniref:Calponin-homology (CH) domain-containing protein n=1 Tax=Mucor circinelloides f. circinelloides (strain 1006PhL) TaxID=1220926 RepID=S2IZS4_MUCC1|nr:hypothetical protein HMPREF1544_09981 [Mucor circinelloides 1006PhL]